MMSKMPLIFTSMALLCINEACAQCVIAGMDTRLPLNGAKIVADNGKTALTDWQGHFAAPAGMKSASIVSKGYMVRKATADELKRDTIFLIPLDVKLQGVVIYAPKRQADTRKWAVDAAVATGVKPTGRSFGGSLSRQRNVSERERARQKKVLDSY